MAKPDAPRYFGRQRPWRTLDHLAILLPSWGPFSLIGGYPDPDLKKPDYIAVSTPNVQLVQTLSYLQDLGLNFLSASEQTVRTIGIHDLSLNEIKIRSSRRVSNPSTHFTNRDGQLIELVLVPNRDLATRLLDMAEQFDADPRRRDLIKLMRDIRQKTRFSD